ncbi:hypothetical protein [Methanospirillum lacunae]|uniref:Cache domain-containing protein n=1 Tax=Methanospirillum lacunae TaxID=668570 RepID=A0A2V2NGF9_9EURY|nr:hypothetical protein [Methanospirillum lacunae]PWR74691.1 hypothetical protein DK846_00105 [Methanospirillum lacunae]
MIRTPVFIPLIAILLFCGLFPGSALADQVNLSGTDLLSKVSSSLSNALDEVDSNISDTAGVFSGETLKTASAEKIVARNKMNIPGCAGIVLVAGNTTLNTLNESYINPQQIETIKSDPSVLNAIAILKPRTGNANPRAGDNMILVTRPAVVDEQNGAAIAVLLSAPFCKAVFDPQVKDTDAIAMVMQPDGTILYISDSSEMDKIPPDNYVTEYPSFRDVKNAMIKEKEGHISYELWRPDPTEPKGREAYWDTIYQNGAEWRVLVAQAIR